MKEHWKFFRDKPLSKCFCCLAKSRTQPAFPGIVGWEPLPDWLLANARSSTASARRQKSPLSITLKNPWLNRTSLVEVNPIAFIVEQAGGAASTGRERILGMQPAALHQRVPVILGSNNEIEWVVGYHYEWGLEEFKSPLFNVRNLFVQ